MRRSDPPQILLSRHGSAGNGLHPVLRGLSDYEISDSGVKIPMGAWVVSDRPFQCLNNDFIGSFPRSKRGNIGIFIIQDHFSKFTFLKAVKMFTAKVVIDILREEIFSCFRVPEVVVSENGTQFKSHEFSTFLTKVGVRRICTCAYAP